MDIKDWRIDVKVRNNNILKRIEARGFKSIAAFCREYGISLPTIHKLIGLQITPLNLDGSFRSYIPDIAAALHCEPEDLFSSEQMTLALKTNKHHMELESAELNFMLQTEKQTDLMFGIIEEENKQLINDALDMLTNRERKVINMRFGLGEYSAPLTLEECGLEFGINKERIRQIEAKALRKLRHPSRSEQLRKVLKHD